MGEAKLAVIMPIYRGVGCIQEAASSLLENTSQPFEFIPVYDGGGAREESLIETAVGLREGRCELFPIRTIRRLGYPRAVNCGVHAMGNNVEWFAFVNQDVSFPPEWDQKLIDCFRVHERIAAVSPLSAGKGSPKQAKDLVPALASISTTDAGTMGEINATLDVLYGGKTGFLVQHFAAFFCVMFRRSAWESVGILDDRLSTRTKPTGDGAEGRWGLGEDEDWCYRARMHPRRWVMGVCRKLYVWHQWGSCFDADVRRKTARLRLPYLAGKFGMAEFAYPDLRADEREVREK